MTSDGFLFPPGDPETQSWHFDVPWRKATDRYSHEFFFRSSGLSPARSRVTLCGPARSVDVLRQVFYGDTSINPKEMTGVSAFFNSRNPEAAQNAVNVLDAGANGGASIWLIGWSETGCYMVTPDGEPASYCAEAAVVVGDWRQVVRIANVSPDETGNVLPMMDEALRRIPRGFGVRPMFYVNPAVSSLLLSGRKKHQEIYIRVIDELRNDEARVD